MSPIDDATAMANAFESRMEDDAVINSDFEFVPRELAAKCRELIESYHAMHGYGCLLDMLWHSDGRHFVESHCRLMEIFKEASKSRHAKRANSSFLRIATLVVSLEVLGRDYAAWGKRFPEAKRDAETLLGDYPVERRVWFMDKYFYPTLGGHRQSAGTLGADSACRANNGRN